MAGYEAYLVGGCVRDAIMGSEVNDFDITTSATPKEMQEVFKNENYEAPEKVMAINRKIVNKTGYNQ